MNIVIFLFLLICYIRTQRNIRIYNNIAIMNAQRTSTITRRTSTSARSTITNYNTTYSYKIPYLHEMLNLELPEINNMPRTDPSTYSMPFRPFGGNDQHDNGDNMFDPNNAILAAFRASENSKIALSAAARAVATCTAYGQIDCEQLIKTKNETDVYIKIAGNSYEQARASANMAIETADNIFKELNNRNKNSVMMSDWASQIAKAAVAQAQIAAHVTATASAQCEIIVDIKCNKCKND